MSKVTGGKKATAVEEVAFSSWKKLEIAMQDRMKKKQIKPLLPGMLNNLELGDILFIAKKSKSYIETIYVITYIKEDKMLFFSYFPPHMIQSLYYKCKIKAAQENAIHFDEIDFSKSYIDSAAVKAIKGGTLINLAD